MPNFSELIYKKNRIYYQNVLTVSRNWIINTLKEILSGLLLCFSIAWLHWVGFRYQIGNRQRLALQSATLEIRVFAAKLATIGTILFFLIDKIFCLIAWSRYELWAASKGGNAARSLYKNFFSISILKVGIEFYMQRRKFCEKLNMSSNYYGQLQNNDMFLFWLYLPPKSCFRNFTNSSFLLSSVLIFSFVLYRKFWIDYGIYSTLFLTYASQATSPKQLSWRNTVRTKPEYIIWYSILKGRHCQMYAQKALRSSSIIDQNCWDCYASSQAFPMDMVLMGFRE